MLHVLNPVVIAEWLSAWGYLGVFICVFIGNLGVPVPEETVLLTAGFLAGRNILDLEPLYLVAIVSAVSGDCCGFLFGRTGGQRLIERLAHRFEFVRVRYERLQSFFETHGSKAVFMARFITGARFMAGPMAGAAGMPFYQFLGWNILGALVWCTLVVTVGYLLGDEFYRAASMTHQMARWIGIAGFILVVVVFFFWWRDRNPVARPEP